MGEIYTSISELHQTPLHPVRCHGAMIGRDDKSCDLWLSRQRALGPARLALPPATVGCKIPPLWIWRSLDHISIRATPPNHRPCCRTQRKLLLPGAPATPSCSRKRGQTKSWFSTTDCRKEWSAFESSQWAEKFRDIKIFLWWRCPSTWHSTAGRTLIYILTLYTSGKASLLPNFSHAQSVL